MIDDIHADARTRMSKSIDALGQEFGKIRTGRAHTSLLDHVMVPYYGSDVPINQVATVSVGDAQTLAITPWEKKVIPDVEKAIMNSNLGLNPVTTGDIIRVPLPPLTEERRMDHETASGWYSAEVMAYPAVFRSSAGVLFQRVCGFRCVFKLPQLQSCVPDRKIKTKHEYRFTRASLAHKGFFVFLFYVVFFF